MITIYQYPKCSTCQRAMAELKQLVSDFEAIDIKANPPKAQDLKHWMETSGYTIKISLIPVVTATANWDLKIK